MRIDPNARIAESPDSGQPKGGSRARESVSNSPIEDTAKLSIYQKRVQALAQKVIATPDIRQEKIDALARSVRDGSYQISAETTSEAIMSHMLLDRAS